MTYDCTAPIPARLRALAKMACPVYFDGEHRAQLRAEGRAVDDRCVGCELAAIAQELENLSSLRATRSMMDRAFGASKPQATVTAIR